jgi:flagellar protein FliL
VADEQGQDPTTPEALPKKKGGFLKIVIIAVAVLAIGGGAGYYFFGKQLVARYLNGDAEATEGAQATVEKNVRAEVGPTFSLEPFVFNVSGDYSRLAKVSIAIEGKDNRSLEETKKRMPVLRDAMLSVLAAKSPELLLNVTGREQIKKELQQSVSAMFPPGDIRGVYITDIILQ